MLCGVSTENHSQEAVGACCIQTDIWTQVTVVVNKEIMEIHFDGALLSSKILLGKIVSNDGDLYIGTYQHRVGVAGGGFDNIQIFNKALT